MPDINALIKLYTEAQQQLVNLIALKQARGNVTWYTESLLKQVNDELQRLQSLSREWVSENIPKAYEQGLQDAIRGLDSLGVSVSAETAFAGLHTAAVEVAMINANAMLADSIRFVGRQMTDAIRTAGLEAIALKLGTGATVKEAAKIVKGKLIQQGLNGIRDKRGRMISLDAYASIVARSTTREATNTATLNQLSGYGYDLVKMSSHATTCPVCAAYQGRVYSISGLTPGYPSLRGTAFSGGYANIHPNCRHVLMPYIPDLADDAEGDKLFSNRPFDIDDRSDTAIQRYNKDQADKRKLRTDRQQFQRYKLALGDDAPKTFANFRRIKNADGERWQMLKSDYGYVMRRSSE